MQAWFGPISPANPLFYLAVYAPSIAAVTVTGYTGGVAGLKDLFGRLLLWRAGLRWYAIVLLGVPALLLISAALSAWLAGNSRILLPDHWQLAIVPFLMSLAIDPGPLGEELGWRGFALPRLLDGRRSALTAAVLLGVVWGTWHLPAFFFSGLPQSGFSFGAFLLGNIALSVLMTWVFQNTGGSVLFAILIHWLVNTRFVPRGTFDMFCGVCAVAAVIVAFATGPTLRAKRASKGSDTNLDV
jgi:membrane protease YdiL (CAAX protease family)